MLRATRKLHNFFIAIRSVFILSILLLIASTVYGQNCGNTWLNVLAAKSGVTIGDLDITGNKITIEARINRTQPYGLFYGGSIVSKNCDSTDVNYLLRANRAEITTTNGFFATPDVDCSIQLNNTYHLAMVYDGSSLKYYRNGYLLSKVACSGNMITNNYSTTFGTTACTTDPSLSEFLGLIDEVRIWNVARTQDQIKTYMDKSLPNPSAQTGLKAYYTFDDLKNEQSNNNWNGSLLNSASIKDNNPACQNFIADSCGIAFSTDPIVNAGFVAPTSVCINEPVTIRNTTTGGTNFYWNFCQGNVNQTPVADNLGNVGNQLLTPVFMDIARDDNGTYYAFSTNYNPGKLIRYNFGNSYLNTPTVEDLGTFNGAIPNQEEGLQIVKAKGSWYVVTVGGGNLVSNSSPRVVTIKFGSSLGNAGVARNWGNVGNLSQPLDLHVFEENNNWYGFTVNADNNTVTRFNFSSNLDNPPTALNLGNIGNLSYPTGIYAINDNGNWRVFITNGGNNSRTGGIFSLSRLDFGTSLLNTPTGINLGNPGGFLKHPRDLTIMKFCGEIIGFAVNGLMGSDDIVKMDFNNDLSSTPTFTSIGNIGNLNFPHSISRIFRVDADLYSFITNVANNTISRLKFSGCTNSNVSNYSDSIPPAITYNTPGVYNINLMVDEGLATQTSVCKTVVVKDCFIPPVVTPGFTLPDTVCVNTPVTIKNTTKGGTNFYWNFCVADINQTPVGTNLGNLGGQLSQPVFIDLAQDDNGDYYGFSINHIPGQLIRYNFGNSYLNNPTVENLGDYGGAIPNQAEGVQIVKSNGKWYAVIVGGGNNLTNSSPRIVIINFGASLGSASQVAANWGNIGNLAQPLDLHVFNEGDNWYGFTINGLNSTITRFDFGNDLDKMPSAVNLGSFGTLAYPDGIYAINDNGFWRVFITNSDNNSITRLDFGNSLLNTPTAVDLGNPGNLLDKPRDITIMKFCGGIVGFVVNAKDPSGPGELTRLDFLNGLAAVPSGASLGNAGDLRFPHSISKIFRVGSDLYSFITNVSNNTITRLKFSGCTNSNFSNSPDSIPPSITYDTPGFYNINLIVDEGLPTQTSLCKSILVVPSPIKKPLFDTAFCAGDSLILKTSFPTGTYTWSNGKTDSTIIIKQPGTYWVQSNYYGCSVRDSINTLQNASPIVNLGADTSICHLDSLLLDAGNPGATYFWQNGNTGQTFNTKRPGTYIVEVTGINGCNAKDSVLLNIYASAQLQLTNDTTICNGSNLTLSAKGNTVQTWTWSPPATLSDPSINNPVATPTNTTIYTVNITDNNGCKESDSILVNVAPLPTVTALADTAICAGSSVLLSANATQGVSYLWNPSGGLSSNTSVTPLATPSINTKYIVTVTTAAGCKALDSVAIAVNPLPALVAGTLDSLICIGNSTTIAATSPTAVSYNWSPPVGLSDPSVATPVATPNITTNYVVETTDINGCKAKDSVQVGIKQFPVFAIDPPSAGVCKGESVIITASGGDEYAWYPPNTLSVSNKPVTVATPDVTTTYKAVITDNICAITDSVFATVNITSLSSIAVTKSNDIDCIIGSTTLKATGGIIYNWSPGTYLSDSTIPGPVAAPLQTTTYYVQVSNASGCAGRDSITVNVFKGSVENGYKLPSAFTPNNDGNNDCFNVRKWGTLAALNFSVYNRWGSLVFHTTNASDCWDGTYQGKLQPPGAYVYQIRAQALCGTVYRKGTVVLVR